MPLSKQFEACGYEELPGWSNDNHALALTAFQRCGAHAAVKPYRTGSLGVESAAFAKAFSAALHSNLSDGASARQFFEAYFLPFWVRPTDRERGFVTGYYEPIVHASHSRTERFCYPVYRRPADLISIDDSNRPEGFDPYLAFARQTGNGLEAYFDRSAIEQGALQDQGLEIAWLADRVDLFFIHVQGAARLRFEDGSEKRITYAAKSGHRFSGPGGILADLGEIPRQQVTMQSIRKWFDANPDRIDEILWQNRSFIFFREAAVDDPSLGPVAAAKVPLTPGRSMAVDRLLHTFATPFFVHAGTLTHVDGAPFSRLMIAQDTGSAITGPARGDLFVGSGQSAGEIAGIIKHDADFFALLPRQLVMDQA
ncbi:MAG: murein transglycosylase A [Rhizobiaceae bacterium]